MTLAPDAARPWLVDVKQRQQQTWSSGDYAVVGARVSLVAERLVDEADLHAGWRVLDVATGSGNAAIAAARLGCTAVGIDYVPALLQRGRERAAAEGLDIELRAADAEELPFGDGSFDAVTSVFGAMFAPDHARTAAELLRVCKPGGRIALASWTPGGFIGGLFRTIGAHCPPPAGTHSPLLWGTESHVRELLGHGVASLDAVERTFTFRFPSPETFVAFFRRWYGPTVHAFTTLDCPGRNVLEHDLTELARRFDRLHGDAVAIPATYLQTLAVKR